MQQVTCHIRLVRFNKSLSARFAVWCSGGLVTRSELSVRLRAVLGLLKALQEQVTNTYSM